MFDELKAVLSEVDKELEVVVRLCSLLVYSLNDKLTFSSLMRVLVLGVLVSS